MKRLFVLFVIAVLAAPLFAQPDLPKVSSFLAQQPASSREDTLYKSGTDALNENRWQQGLDTFTEIIKLNGRRVDAAMYWKAYAQHKLNQAAAALETLGELNKKYPRSQWVNDARALEVEIRGKSGQGATVANQGNQPCEDEELKLLAINSLMNMDPERALPLLEKVLSTGCSPKIKERALFVLSQNGSERGAQILGQIARGSAGPELQIKAIRNLGINGNSANKAVLLDIYKTATDVRAKREVLNAFGISGGKKELLDAAKGEKDPDLKKAAIRGLAVAGGREELRQLYKDTTDAGMRIELVRSTIVSGDHEFLASIVQSDPDPAVKIEAVRTLGIAGGRGAGASLVNIYNTEKDRKVRDAALQGLFVAGDTHSMVELAKKETDPEMKKAIIQKLSIMGHDKEVMDYLMQILEK